MNQFFTGKGDFGQSKIYNRRYAKSEPIFQVLGELDELNSLLGLARNYLSKKLQTKLKEVQEDLFLIQAILAERYFLQNKKRKFAKEKIARLEKEIHQIGVKLPPITKFTIPGSNKESAWLDYLRSIVRRVERSIVDFERKKKILPKEAIAYLNRLSSYFYILARRQAFQKNIKENNPKY